MKRLICRILKHSWMICDHPVFAHRGIHFICQRCGEWEQG